MGPFKNRDCVCNIELIIEIFECLFINTLLKISFHTFILIFEIFLCNLIELLYVIQERILILIGLNFRMRSTDTNGFLTLTLDNFYSETI